MRNSSVDAPSQYLGQVQHVVMLIGRDRQYGKGQQQQPRKAGSRKRGLSDLENKTCIPITCESEKKTLY